MMPPRKLRTVLHLTDGAHEIMRRVVPASMVIGFIANDNRLLEPVA